jgi:hypothetical protein
MLVSSLFLSVAVATEGTKSIIRINDPEIILFYFSEDGHGTFVVTSQVHDDSQGPGLGVQESPYVDVRVVFLDDREYTDFAQRFYEIEILCGKKNI